MCKLTYTFYAVKYAKREEGHCYMINPSKEFIDMICREYGDVYNDEIEDSAPGGLDWHPGQKADHTFASFIVFDRIIPDCGCACKRCFS